MVNIEQIIDDLVKGASRARGGVEIAPAQGTESKFAYVPGGGLAAAGMGMGSMLRPGHYAILPGLAGLAGAGIGGAVEGSEGHKVQSALGGVAGGLGGTLLGSLIGDRLGIQGGRISKMLGGMAGAGLGSALADHPEQSIMDKLRSKLSTARSSEPKHASIPGVLGGGLLGGLGGGLGGSLAGAGTGALLSKLIPGYHPHPSDVETLSMIGGGVGAAGGMLAGGTAGRDDPSLLHRLKGAALQHAYTNGAQAAAACYKVAFAPLISAGLSALAPALGRSAVSRFAPKALGAISKPVGGAMFDMGSQMAAQKAMSPRQQQ